MPTTRGRLIQNNLVVYDQADFFQLDGYNRVLGLTPANLVGEMYFNNVLQTWPLITGEDITDSKVVAGHIYWDDLGHAYGVRWRPNAIGYWRLLISYPVGTQILAQDYDVGTGIGTGASGSLGGLKASFFGPNRNNVNDC